MVYLVAILIWWFDELVQSQYLAKSLHYYFVNQALCVVTLITTHINQTLMSESQKLYYFQYVYVDVVVIFMSVCVFLVTKVHDENQP